MKSLNIALAAGLAFIAVPASAQQQLLSDSDQFIEAVQKSDGDKATELVQSHPTIVDARNNKGDTGLIIAIGRKDPNWTGFLLNNGADPNLPGANGDTPLIEAAKVAPIWNPDLALVHEKALQKGNRNRATLAVARKLVAYLLAVDRRETPFRKGQESAAAA